jgi:hypothetical protein
MKMPAGKNPPSLAGSLRADFDVPAQPGCGASRYHDRNNKKAHEKNGRLFDQ